MLVELLYVAAAFLVGALVGMTGVGGGSLMTPLLIIFFGITPMTAVATDLIAIFFIKSFGALSYFSRRSFNMPIVFGLLAGSVPASIVSVHLLHHYGQGMSDELVTWVLLAVVAITLVLTFLRPVIHQWQKTRHHKHGKPEQELQTASFKYRYGVLFCCGIVLGVLVSISSVGGGVLGLAIIGSLYPGMPIRFVIGSDILHTLVLSMVAGMGYLANGHVDYNLLLFLSLGGIPGVLLGSRLMHKMSEKTARTVVFLVLAGILIVLFRYKLLG